MVYPSYLNKKEQEGETFFYIYKFRTMKKNTPDIPTDKLSSNPFYFGGKMLKKLVLMNFLNC